MNKVYKNRASSLMLGIALATFATAAHAQADPAGGTVMPPAAQPGDVASAPASQTPSEAKPPPSANEGIGDIVVTAERREQSVQKSPLTIQVLSGDQLVKSGVSDVLAIQKLAPGLNIGSGGGNTQIFIRGVGGFAFTPLSSPGVAFNVDGVYVGRPEGVNGNFYDVARVEVLKGPQGTLYGRNANGGSINVITNELKLSARTLDLNLEVGDYSLVHTSGAVNLPIGTTAAVRAAFNIVNRDGYISNGTDDDIEQSARLRFKWTPDPDVTLLLSGDYSHFGGKGSDYVYRPVRPGGSPYEAQSTPENNAYMHAFGPLGPLIDDQRDDNFQNTKLYNISAQLDWKLPFATLTVLPAYRHFDANYLTHFATRYESHGEGQQKSLETRLGHSSSRLTWVLGGYYFDETQHKGYVNVFASNIIQNYLLHYEPVTKAYAGFGQATFSVVDRLRLIGGVRYTYEKRNLTGFIDNQATVPVSRLETFGGRKSFDGITYKVGAEFDVAPRSLIYLTYSTGFKSGGFSQTVAPLNVFKPERLKALEFGSRNRFLDNRLQLNFGAFHWKYSDIQDQRVNFDPLGNVNFITFNSGTATLYGGNIDVIARPTERDTISLAGEYVHSKYDRFFFQTPVPFLQPGSEGCPLSGPYAPGATLPYTDANGSNTNDGPLPVLVGNCKGLQLARTPKWTGTLSYDHVFPLADDATVVLGGSVRYTSTSYLNIDFIPSELQKRYAVVDADLTYNSPDKRVSAGLFVRNLTKKVYYTGAIESSFIGGLVGANIAAPRTYGVRLSFKLGQ